MKYVIITLLFSAPVFSKESFIYSCIINKELKSEISLLDKNTPSIDLFYKNSKYASCLYENTPMSHAANPRALIQEAIWQLKLKSCNYYYEKYKDKILVENDVSFKQAAGKHPSYLALVQNGQPLTCIPKK